MCNGWNRTWPETLFQRPACQEKKILEETLERGLRCLGGLELIHGSNKFHIIVGFKQSGQGDITVGLLLFQECDKLRFQIEQ